MLSVSKYFSNASNYFALLITRIYYCNSIIPPSDHIVWKNTFPNAMYVLNVFRWSHCPGRWTNVLSFARLSQYHSFSISSNVYNSCFLLKPVVIMCFIFFLFVLTLFTSFFRFGMAMSFFHFPHYYILHSSSDVFFFISPLSSNDDFHH